MIPPKKIVVFAEFGGAYLCVKSSTDKTSYVGGNIGDASAGVPSDYGVSIPLQADFREWIINWETTVCSRVEYDDIAPRSFWDEIHQEGLALARRLKVEVCDQYEVEYHAPWEDPERGGGEGLISLIENDGRLHTYQPIKAE
jgi:hypothetical protein